jgi:hypothetical protein
MQLVRIGTKTFDLSKLVAYLHHTEWGMYQRGGLESTEVQWIVAYFDGGPAIEFRDDERELFLRVVREQLKVLEMKPTTS